MVFSIVRTCLMNVYALICVPKFAIKSAQVRGRVVESKLGDDKVVKVFVFVLVFEKYFVLKSKTRLCLQQLLCRNSVRPE